MKKLLFLLVLAGTLSVLSFSTASGQACPPNPPDGKCSGNCDPWFFRSVLNQPVLAGTPKCVKITGQCHCVLLHTGNNCNASGQGTNCEGTCPDVYPTAQDALNGTNGIRGICITQRTITIPYCACQYVK